MRGEWRWCAVDVLRGRGSSGRLGCPRIPPAGNWGHTLERTRQEYKTQFLEN